MTDSVLDLIFIPKWLKGIGFVHKGFAIGYNSARVEILNEIDKMIIENIETINEICVYGYSMGGAYAVLNYLDLETNETIPTKCVIWGMPPIFLLPSGKLKEKLKEVIRVVYEKDMFTILPFFYSHVGRLWKIGKCKDFWNVKSHEMYYQCNDELI